MKMRIMRIIIPNGILKSGSEFGEQADSFHHLAFC